MTYPRADIEPDLLKWAREKAGFDTVAAAKKISVKEERLISWEEGGNKPTINQLRKAANVYKVPVSVLYLAERPETFQPMRDLRRLPGDGLRFYSPGLTREMEMARQKRNLAIELADELREEPKHFTLKATMNEDPEQLGHRIRSALAINNHLQAQWREPRVAFNVWREHMEELGVLVFQMKLVDSDEASGFALTDKELPIIAVNRKDVFARRVFSLLHEFTHLMLRISGTSDLHIDASRPPEDEKIEIYCNKVAASALMPRDHLLGEDIVQFHGGDFEWHDNEIDEIALRYSVSREAIVRRLLTFGRTSEKFYIEKRSQYAAEHVARIERQREQYRSTDKEFRMNPARDTVLDNGRPFVRLVIDNYHQDRITLSEASGYLGVKVRHIPKIEYSLRGI